MSTVSAPDAAASSASPSAAAAGILATPAQARVEQVVLAVENAPELQAARRAARAQLLKETAAQSPDGIARIDHALDHWIRALVQRHAGTDLDRPAFIWMCDETARDGQGYAWPGAGIGGLANPDNVYRATFLDGSAQYEVTGRIAANPSAHFSLELARQEPGRLVLTPAPGNEADLGDQVGILTIADIRTDAEGNFRVTIGPEAGDDQHIRSTPGTLTLNHRDTLAHWSQVPNRLAIRRIDGPALGGTPAEPLAGAPDDAEVIRRTVESFAGFLDFWTGFRNYFMGVPEHNRVAGPVVRDGGWGLAAGGRYRLAADEVLLIRVAQTDAVYSSIQSGGPWMMVGSSRDLQNSLNRAQTVAGEDGTITFAIAPEDPGLANWVETDGSGDGWFMLRWQWPGARKDDPTLIRDARVVRRGDLDTLAADLPRVTPAERAAQRARRRADYDLRLG